MNSNIFIPKKIKVGFRERDDTFTKMLGYVIYHDGKVWRKEKSWESWRSTYIDTEKAEKIVNGYNKSLCTEQIENQSVSDFENLPSYYKHKKSTNIEIDPKEFENIPVEGFVLNKKAGGYKSGWNHRQTYCRIFDPRGFEFEITIPNLLYILENANAVKGKGLEGKFIYGWEGTELILIPEQAPEYEEMVKFTEIQLSASITKKDLIPGWKYLTKQKEVVTYLGYFEEGRKSSTYNSSFYLPGTKKHWFYTDAPKYNWNSKYRFITRSDYKNLVQKLDQDPEYSNLLDGLEKLSNFQAGMTFEFIPATRKECETGSTTASTYFAETNDGFYEVRKYGGGNSYLEYMWESKDKFNVGKAKRLNSNLYYRRDFKINQYYLLKIKDKNGKETIVR